MINGALLALLVLTLPKAAAPLPDDALWVSLETAAAETAGAPAMQTPPPAAASPPAAAAPPVPAVSKAAEQPVQPPRPAQTHPSDSPPDSKPSPTPNPPSPVSTATGPAQAAPVSRPVQSQTQSQTPTQAQSPAVGGGPKHAASYAARVRLHLESFKVYPPQAKRRHQTGIVSLSFTIDRQGRVLSAQVTKSSGVAALDQAALDMLAAAQPLPKPPSDITGERISLTVPVEFGETE